MSELYVESAGNQPTDPKLWAEVKAAAKKKFTVYPSAYANGWAVQEYKKRGGKWRETSADDRVPVEQPCATEVTAEAASKDEGLGKWFAEKWVDISRTDSDGNHPACGRPTAGMSQSDYAKAYPKCVPASKARSMSDAAKKDAVNRKRNADNASGDRKGQKPNMVSTQRSDVETAKGPQATAKDKDPKGGLSAAGRKKFGVKKGVTNYSGASEEDKKRWVRWALRFTKTPRPLKDDNGKPTRYALMFNAWGEPVPTSASAVKAVHNKAVARAKQLKMGQYEKAEDSVTFPHEWEAVAGQPVHGCAVCGDGRYTREHLTGLAEQAATRKPYGDVTYADPGYQSDGKSRYPIDTPDHVRSAWSYINQSGNAAKYSPSQREKIKSRIASAAKKFNIDLQGEQAALIQRLTKNYGRRVDAVGTPPGRLPNGRSDSNDGLPDTPPMGSNLGGVSPREAEDRAIAENADTPAAQGPHPFMEAEFPGQDGQARCRLCGQDNASHKVFEPEVPVAAAAEPAVRATLPTSSAALYGGITSTTNSAGGAQQVQWTWTATPVVAPTLPTVVPPVDTAKAFLTEVNGRTLLTAPASTFTDTEKALHANEHFLWMQGRFVGAEKANRNGAFWTTEDLELGELTVRHGPLNWLHEAKHVIGTIANTEMITPRAEAAAEGAQPHISALSAVWKWIYPDEAWVIEQASDSGKLWYSMECVSREVACVGDNGCGAKASYGDYLAGKGGTCAHMTERSATRHFANPTFLGGAVIVPPVRPGWAEADASVLRQAASLSEKAYEQAGRPDVAASDWEQLMAQLVRYATV